MREGVLTEREWLSGRARPPRRHPRCWGAQCMLPVIERSPSPYRRYRRYATLWVAAVTAAVTALLWVSLTRPVPEYPVLPAISEAVERLPGEGSARPNSAVSYLPVDMPQRQVTLSRTELLRGKLMRLDAGHPLPDDAPAPNAVSIATYGKGMVPVRNLTLKTGKQTIAALKALFEDARRRGVEGLAVWRGITGETEQRELQLGQVRLHSTAMSLSEAVQKARGEVDDPRAGDFQQEYTVDIRLCAAGQGDEADARPLGLTEQGRYLLQNAWRFGLIRRYPLENDNPFRAYQFRFVGVAHSTAMTYLDLELEAYLELLHTKRSMQIQVNGALRYVILCQPIAGDYVSLSIPEGWTYEASYDNMGYAVVACAMP